MSLTIRNNTNNLFQIYKYNNFQKLQSAFTNKSESINKTTNSSVSNVCGVKYGEDPEQVLIEDRVIYEAEKKYGYLKDIEFGSDEWNKWKTENCNITFPPLNAPASVRKAFREARESIPKEDKKSLHELRCHVARLSAYQHYPQYFDLKGPLKLETPSDYEALLNLDTGRKTSFADIDCSNKETYLKLIDFNNTIINKLHENLFGL